jgi:hypothetical protein
VRGLEGVSWEQLKTDLLQGGRFVVYYYTVSILVMTYRRGSDVYYIPPGRSRIMPGLPWTLLSLLTGWWGVRWGPIYTIQSLWINLTGGKDVTEEIVAALTDQNKAPASVAEAARG